MFFDDDEMGPKKGRSLLKVPPPTPATRWTPPREYPNLSAATILGIDLERREHDPEHGPGWRRGKAETVGFSVAARDRLGNQGAWYFPIGHKIEPQYNLEREPSLRWLKSILETNVPKVGANLLYDIGSLTDDSIHVQGELHDVQYAEALLDTDNLVNLDNLGVTYLGQGKETSQLYEWLANAYGGKPNQTQRLNIWRASPRLVGPYAERDADSPIRILEKQWPRLQAAGLLELYRMECDLIPLLIQMRIEGVTVDLDLAEQLYEELAVDIARLYVSLFELTGIAIDSVQSGRDVAKIFDAVGISYPTTAEGNPSFRKDWLKNLEHPVATLINDIREHEKVRSTFVKNYILDGNVNGKIHCQFHPLRGDDDGTKTGRFSSSDPNLQNIPVRTKLGKRVRQIFVKDRLHLCWEKNDYSQIEYRGLAHYAVGPGSDALRETYCRDPRTDYHKATQTNVKNLTGKEIDRRPIKNLNFGLIYGMSEKKLIRQNGFTDKDGREVFKAYHLGNPYVRPTMKAAADEMQALGYITTVTGRRIHFNTWEPIEHDYNEQRPYPLPYDLAIHRWGSRIKRAGEHKAINYRLQGSAADQIKAGMVKAFYSGVFNVIGVPRLQVHDELDFSVVDDNPQQNEAFKELRYILENAIKLRVPVIVDFDRGPSWGELED